MSGTASDGQYNGSEIAIIGMAGRFPGAGTIEQFWHNLREGVESVSFLTDEELKDNRLDPALLRHPNYVKARGVVEGAELFDAAFFGYSPREAEVIDPQQRVFLECAWEALEDAGYISEPGTSSIGVYAGASMSSYVLYNLFSNLDLVNSVGGFQTTISNDKDFLSTRVSYKLNLEGPSVAIQTACSTSLVAVHLACQGLLSGECDLALSGGVSIHFPQNSGHLYQQGGILSPDGHCRAFDAQAQGTVGGNGAGVVVLKRLGDALRDRDSIYAVIKGSAINNDGSSKVGFTAPRVESQAKVIRSAQLIAGVEAESIGYIEAHGTGTALGDPIELSALTKAFRASTDRQQFCALGSVKTNVGHLDAAAGIAGLIKTALALRHRELPPSLHFTQPNPDIDFASSPFFVNATLRDWPATDAHPRRAGISSFGIGGTNAHVVLEEAPPAAASTPATRPQHLLLLSARTDTALETAAANLSRFLHDHPEADLADVAYTLQVGRRAFPHRRALLCRDAQDALTQLQPRAHRPTPPLNGTPALAFMFAGQGTQYPNLTRELYETQPVVKRYVDRGAELLQPELGLDLRELLYPREAAGVERAARHLRQTELTQPALFVVEYALAQLWLSWGVRPAALIGHSLGEYVAACVAGVFTMEEGVRLVAGRGRLMAGLPGGAMLAVSLSAAAAAAELGGDLSLAAVNGAGSCVVSGRVEAVAELEGRLRARQVACTRLATSHAFHSGMMEPMLGAFAELLQSVRLEEPRLPLISNVTGSWMRVEEAVSREYWVRHLRETVEFGRGLETLLGEPRRVLLEIGPGQTLKRVAGGRLAKGGGQVAVSTLAGEGGGERESVERALGELWAAGVGVDWGGYYGGEKRRRLPLPTYPFERERFWIEPGGGGATGASERKEQGKKKEVGEWFYLPSWKRSLLPAVATAEAEGEGQPRPCLIFLDDCGVGARLAARLKSQGREVVAVVAGERFQRVEHDLYVIEVGSRRDYDTLIKELNSEHRLPSTMLHLWGVTPNSSGRSIATPAGVEQAERRGFYSLLFLAQALGQQEFDSPVRLAVVTNGLQDVTGDETLNVEKATTFGPCKVIPQEFANVTCQSIDVVLSEADEGGVELLVEQLLDELTGSAAESVIAYRGAHRWTLGYERVRLDAVGQKSDRLREGGVYVITGGLGGIGLALGRYLAEAVRAKLVLLSRAGLPERNEWTRYLETHEETDRTSLQIRRVGEIEALGGEVLALAVDVTDETEMRAAVAEALRRFGKINGVIHAAGVPSGGVIQLKAEQTVAEVLAAKVKGTLVLEAVLGESRLDFMLLCSSLASVNGGVGQVDYCAANAFLDAFARWKARRAGAWVASINWGMWQEVGMAVETKVPAKYREQRALELKEKGIRPEEGVEAFKRILGQRRIGQIAVAPVGLQLNGEAAGKSAAGELGERDGQPRRLNEVPAMHARPDLPNPFVSPTTATEEGVCRIWQELLGIVQVGVNDNFFDLGGHSLLATQLGSRVRDTFHVDLPLRELYEEPTVAGLSRAILNTQGASQTPQGPQLKPIARQRQRLVRSERGELLTAKS